MTSGRAIAGHGAAFTTCLRRRRLTSGSGPSGRRAAMTCGLHLHFSEDRSMFIPACARISLALCLVGLVTTSPAMAADPPGTWNKTEAGRALDERAAAWFAFPRADRGEGETKTTCISCHSLAPFALARPVLRKLTGSAQPTEAETKLLAQVKLRVEHWNELDSAKFGLMYDFDEQKQKESRGTEAVVSALLLASDDRNQGQSAPTAVTRTALTNLWRTQLADGDRAGSWEWLDFKLEPWEARRSGYYGAALAAIAVGTAPGYYRPGADAELDGNVARLRTYLRGRRSEQRPFERTWLLWASSRLEGLLSPDERKALVAELLDLQQEDGGWRLAALLGDVARVDGTPQDTASDGYATGLVLHALQLVGVPKTDPKIARGLNWLVANQSANGEWRTNSVNKQRDPQSHIGRFMSDAATAYAVLALSHQ